MAVGLAVLAAACGGGDDGGAAAAGGDQGAGAGSPTAAAVAGGGLEATCEAGAEEGGFTYWATFEPDNFDRIEAAFAETYPGIDVELLPLRPEETVQRILTAVSAGQPVEPDLVNGNIEALLPLVDRDVIDTEVDWSDVGDIAEDLHHPDYNMVRIYRVANGLAYNTETTDPADLPDTWEELVDERWAGDVVVDPRGNPFTNLGTVWGEEETVDYVQRLDEVVDPIVIEGGTAGMQAVISGEAMISTGGRADTNSELQAQGAPIDVKYLDIVPVQEYYQMLMVDSDAPNAAACFTGWLVSEEGSAVHEEVEGKPNATVPPQVPQDAEIAQIATAEEAALGAELVEQISAIWAQ